MMKKIIILILLLMIPIATAITWTQYTPSPTSNQIDRVFSLSNGKAFAYTTSGTNLLLYNGSSWNEISPPTSLITDTPTFKYADKLSNGRVLLIYENGSKAIQNIIEYNPITNSYSLFVALTGHTTIDSFECDQIDDKCYITYGSSSKNFSQIYPTTSDLVNSASIVGTQANLLLKSTDNMWERDTTNGQVSTFNGISWVTYTLTGGGSAVVQKVLEQGNYKAIISPGTTIAFYNVTSNTISSKTLNVSNLETGTLISGTTFYANNASKMLLCSFTTQNCTPETSMLGAIYGIDYDSTSGMGWAGGDSGIIYMYNDSTAGTSANYTLTSSVSLNPVVYGTTTIISAKPTSNTGMTSTITVSFWNGTDMFYTWNWQNVPSGYTATNPIQSTDWTNFPIGIYTIKVNSTEGGGTGKYAYATDITWNVTIESTTEIIKYTLSETIFNNTEGLYFKGIDNYGNNILYATTKNNSIYGIATFDYSDLNNIQTDYYTLPDTNTTASFNGFTSISINDARLYAGSNNELFVFNTTSSGFASNIILHDNVAMTGADNIYDTTNVNDNYAWICQHGYFSDDIRMYNMTSNDLNTALSINPCQSILYDNTTDLLIIHQISGGIKIYNQSTRTIITSLNDSITLSGTATHDLISINGNNLFFISGTQSIKKYDITNPSNTLFVAECRTDREIQSLEAINNNNVIIGATNKLEVCEFNNNDTFFASGGTGYYISTDLKSESYGIPLEITKNTINKFAVTYGNQLGFYSFSSETINVTSNNAPIITSLDISNTNPCINETINVEINAIDNEGDTITYDWDCNGIQAIKINSYLYDTFYCSYTSSGTKNLEVWAKDDNNTAILYTQTINVNNCTAGTYNLIIKITDCDTGAELPNVTAIIGNDTQNSNINGNVVFSLTQNKEYDASFTLTNYFPKTVPVIPTNLGHLCLSTQYDGSGLPSTALIIITRNADNLSAIPDSFVSVSNSLTGENEYGWTDINGQIIFPNSFTGDKLLISGKNENNNYPTQSTYTNLNPNEQKTVYLDMTREMPEGEFKVTNRNCKDAISGILLCGNLSITGVGNSCSNDTGCISGDCFKESKTAVNGTCSSFNWSYCDVHGYGRGNGCFLIATTYGTFSGLLSTILTYAIFVFVLILIISLIVLARRKK